MRGVFLALWILTTASAAVAQESQEPSAPVVHTDEDTGERYVEERPSEAIRRGSVIAPPWAIYAAGTLVVMVSILLLARRLRSSS